jgi:hypothetical protein
VVQRRFSPPRPAGRAFPIPGNGSADRTADGFSEHGAGFGLEAGKNCRKANKPGLRLIDLRLQLGYLIQKLRQGIPRNRKYKIKFPEEVFPTSRGQSALVTQDLGYAFVDNTNRAFAKSFFSCPFSVQRGGEETTFGKKYKLLGILLNFKIIYPLSEEEAQRLHITLYPRNREGFHTP